MSGEEKKFNSVKQDEVLKKPYALQSKDFER